MHQNNTTAMNADGTVPLQTDTRPTGDHQRYIEQNPAYPPQGQQQPVPQGLNSGPAIYDSSTHPSQGQYGNNLDYGAGRGTLAHTQQNDTKIDQGQYGSAPPTSLTNFSHGAPGAGHPAVPPANIINSNSTTDYGSGPSLKRTVGKVEFAVGSILGSNSLKASGLQKKKEANAVEIQALEIAEAERLEQEALMRRERAVAHGAHPANSVLGGTRRNYS